MTPRAVSLRVDDGTYLLRVFRLRIQIASRTRPGPELQFSNISALLVALVELSAQKLFGIFPFYWEGVGE